MVPILNDSLVELAEAFQTSLRDPTGRAELGGRKVVPVRIPNNDTGWALESAQYRDIAGQTNTQG